MTEKSNKNAGKTAKKVKIDISKVIKTKPKMIKENFAKQAGDSSETKKLPKKLGK